MVKTRRPSDRTGPTARAREARTLHPDVLAQLRALFDECSPQLDSWARRVRASRSQGADRDDREQEFWLCAWQSFLALARRGVAILPHLKQVGYYAWKRGLSNRHASGVNRKCLAPTETKPADNCPFVHSLEATPLGGPVAYWGNPGAQRCQDWNESLLADRRGTDPALRAQLRLDMADWWAQLPAIAAHVAEYLAKGEGTTAVAIHVGRTAGRISQLRNELRDSWNCFQGE